jgi:hypothetical protein
MHSMMKNTTVSVTCALLFVFMTSLAEEGPDSKPWRKIASGSQSNIEEASRKVIQSQEQWRKWWEKHNTVEKFIDGKTVPKPPPKVDFEKESVLVATLGRRSTGGSAVRFTEICRKDGVLTATFQISSPGPEDMVTMALTSPFVVIAIPKHEGSVKFIDKTAK